MTHTNSRVHETGPVLLKLSRRVQMFSNSERHVGILNCCQLDMKNRLQMIFLQKQESNMIGASRHSGWRPSSFELMPPQHHHGSQHEKLLCFLLPDVVCTGNCF